MATTRTTLVLLVLSSLIAKNSSDSDVLKNFSIDKDDLLRGSGEEKEIIDKDIELNQDDNTTTEINTTTNIPDEKKVVVDNKERVDEKGQNNVDEKSEKNEKDEKEEKDESKEIDETTTINTTETDTTEGLDNNVIRTTVEVDIYNNASSVQMETTTSATTKAIDTMEGIAPKVAEFDGEPEISGQRNPKTENTDQKLPDRPFFEPTSTPTAVSPHATLKGWLEDGWLRAPAGVLVPLRSSALARAQAVWDELVTAGLDLSDIVLVGYDSNGINWRSRHNLQSTSTKNGKTGVSDALSKLLTKYQGVHSENDGTMRALTSATKLVPYDSALFLLTDKGAGDPQRLPLALRALVEKRLKVYTIWTNPSLPTPEIEKGLQELRNVSRHTEGEVLPYTLQRLEAEATSNMATEVQSWDSMESNLRQARLNSFDDEKFETLLVRRGGGGAISLGIPVEYGVTALRIYIEGAVEHAVLYPPNDAAQVDLYNTTSVSAFSPSSRTDRLSPRDVYLIFPGADPTNDMHSVIPLKPEVSSSAMAGMWHLSVRCDTCDYRLSVSARAVLRFHAFVQPKELLKIRVMGPVASVRESALVDEYGEELAKLPFSYQPIAGESQDKPVDSPIAELEAVVPLPSVKAGRVYAKILGRDVRGEPFVRLSGPLNQQSEVRMGRSAVLNSWNDLEQSEEANAREYARLRFNDSNVLPYNQAMTQVVNQQGVILTAVQVGLSTRLYGTPGANLQLHFEVTNYRDQSVRFTFQAIGEQRFLRGISPTSQTIGSGQTANVIVSVGITSTAQAGSRDLITFTAFGMDQVSISTYVYVVNNVDNNDVWAPELRHNFQGMCINRLGDDCAEHVWSATIFARDTSSGLLRLVSSPIGLMYDSNFIAGTREQVMATYRATCCAPRLSITAMDARGNVNSYVIDISGYLNGASIAAIILAVFLAIVIIAAIIFAIYWCVRRRKESRELPYTTSTRNLS